MLTSDFNKIFLKWLIFFNKINKKASHLTHQQKFIKLKLIILICWKLSFK